MSKNKKVDWTIIPTLSELTGLICSAKKLSQDIQKNICIKIDDPNSSPKDNMTLEEVSNYLMDIENDAGRMQDGLEHVIQLLHPGVSLDNMAVLGRKIRKKDIHYLTEISSLLYPMGSPKEAYRCWCKNSLLGTWKSALIDDKTKFPKLKTWNITPSSRMFINAFYRNCPLDTWTVRSKTKYDLKLVVAEFPVSLFTKITDNFNAVNMSKIFTSTAGMEFMCKKTGKGIQTRYEIVSSKPSILTTEEIEMMNKKGLFDLDTLDFVKDELTLKKKFGI